MAISKELAKKILESVIGGVSYIPVANWYFGLSSLPIVDDLIPVGAEPQDGTGYNRKPLRNSQLSATVPTGTFTPADTSKDNPIAVITNAQTIEMDEISSGNEPDVEYFFLAETPENSNLEGASRKVSMWGKFDRARKMVINSNLIVEVGGAVFELYNVVDTEG